MPKIELKPHSAEYAERKNKAQTDARYCDMPGCAAHAEHKAPKNRQLNDYFYFCYEHVCDYNKAWNYFSGMTDSEMEDHIIRSALWDRPTWDFKSQKHMEEELLRKASRWRDSTADTRAFEKEQEKRRNAFRYSIPPNSPEFEALVVMGLEPPLNPDLLKKRYKELVKKHHPDINQNNPESEELLKRINMAYTILKVAHEKFALFEEKFNS